MLKIKIFNLQNSLLIENLNFLTCFVFLFFLNKEAGYLNYFLLSIGVLSLSPFILLIQKLIKLRFNKNILSLVRILILVSNILVFDLINRNQQEINIMQKSIADKDSILNGIKKLGTFNDDLYKIDSVRNTLNKHYQNKYEKSIVDRIILSNLLSKTRSAFDLNDYHKSIELIDYLIRTGEKNGEIFFLQGVATLNIGDKISAIKSLGTAITYNHPGARELYDKLNPLKKRISHYVTLCCDGTYSYSKGRGTCSWHKGVCNWNYPIYETYREF